MSKKARRNSINATSQLVERKKMYKAKKQWMVAGMSFLVAMGLGAVASTQTGIHASAIQQNPAHQSVNNALNQKKAQSTQISASAQNIHAKAMQGVQPSAQSKASVGVQSAQSSAQPQAKVASAKSNVQSSGLIKPMIQSKVASAKSAQPSANPVQKSAVAQSASVKSVAPSSAIKPVNASASAVKPFGSSSVAKVASAKPIASANPVASASAKSSVSSVGAKAIGSSSNQVASGIAKPKVNVGLGAVRQANSVVSASQQRESAQPKPLVKLADLRQGAQDASQNQQTQQDTDYFNFVSQGDVIGKLVKVNGAKNSTYTVTSDMLSQAGLSSKDYQLANDGSQNFKFSDSVHAVGISPSSNIDNPQYHIPVTDLPVNFHGNIDLHFHSGSDTIKDIVLPYNISSHVSYKIADILKSTSPSAVIPASYLNQVIQNFNTKNFTYDNNQKSTAYDNFYIDPTNTGNYTQKNGQGDYNNGTLQLNFSANGNMPENINFDYNGGKGNAGKGTIRGNNDTPGDVTSDVAQHNGMKPGWHVVNKDNKFTYGNGGSDASGSYSDTKDVQVAPNSANATVEYQVSDNSANSTNKGSDISSFTSNGNDSRTSGVASDTSFNINQGSGSATNPFKVPAGYHVISGQNTNIPFDNGKHTIKIIGNDHNANGQNTGNASDINPSTLPKNNPNYVPASDVVTVHEKEFDNGQYIRTLTQYTSEKGKTGEKYSVSPYNFIPNGYQVTPGEQAQTGTFNANGVSNPDITFQYDAKIGTDISVSYVNQNGATVGSGTITGNVDDKGNILDKSPIPKGYHYVSAKDNNKDISGASATDIPYRITTNGQNFTVTVAGNKVSPNTPIISDTTPNAPSDKPDNPAKPSDVPGKPVKPGQPSDSNHPSDNPQVPTTPSDKPDNTDTKPNGTNTTPNQPNTNKMTPKDPKDANDTFYVTINDFGYDRKNGQYDKLERQYIKRITPQGDVGNTFHISPDTYVTNGYNESDTGNKPYTGYFGANGLLASDDKTPQDSIVWNYDANVQTAHIHYTDQSGNDVTPSSDTISGHTDSDINPTDPHDGGVPVPSGYHVAPGTKPNYHFHDPTNNPDNNSDATYKVEGNIIKGNAIVNLVYQEPDGVTADTRTSQIKIPFTKRVGDAPLTVLAAMYDRNGYGFNNNVWTVPFTANLAQNGDNDNYDPSTTFTYQGQSAGPVNVEYIDVDNQSAMYNKQVGSQSLGDLGSINQQIELAPIGANTASVDSSNGDKIYDDLQVPTGYALVHHINPLTIQLAKGQLTLRLFMKPIKKTNPVQPNKQAQFGQVTVNYKDGANVIDSITTDGKIGSDFNADAYKNVSIPNYHVTGVINGNIKYNANPQNVTMVETKDATPAPQVINHYINVPGNTQVVNHYIDVPTGNGQTRTVTKYVQEPNSDSAKVAQLEQQLNGDGNEINELEQEVKNGQKPNVVVRPQIKIINIHNDKQLMNMKVNQVVRYGGNKIKRISLNDHYRYFKVYRTILLHGTFNSVGSLRHVKGFYTPRQLRTVFIKGLYKIHFKSGKSEFRYLIQTKSRHGHKGYAFVTGNPKWTRDSYLSVHKSYKGVHFVTRRTLLEHRHVNGKALKKVPKGTKLTIKRIANISKHKRNQLTRIQLSNGLWISANLNYIKLVK